MARLTSTHFTIPRALLGMYLAIGLAACSTSNVDNMPQSDEPVIEELLDTKVTNPADQDKEIPVEKIEVEKIPVENIPAVVKCSFSTISKDTGYLFTSALRCTDKWAVGLPDEFFSGEGGGEAGWVLAKKNSTWTAVSNCHAFYPIRENGYTCYSIGGGDNVNLADLPPMEVQCALWDASSWKEYAPETGCPEGDF